MIEGGGGMIEGGGGEGMMDGRRRGGGGEGKRGGGHICCLPGQTFMSSQWIMMDDGAFLVDLDFQPGSALY